MPLTALYSLQGVKPAEIAAAPFDVKVVDVYNDNGNLHSAAEVALMGGGPGGALLLGYFSLGEAEVYRDYFDTIPAAAIGPENPQWKGNYEVKFWTPEWKAVAVAYIDRMIAAGYDGAYFDVVDECMTAWARKNAPGGAIGAEQAMIDLIKDLKAHARAVDPDFKIWVNNAEELLTHADYLAAIDGMFKENLFYTDSGKKQPASETKWSLDLLQTALDAGKDVVSIEYVSGAQKIADVHALNAQYGLASYIADIDLEGVNLSGVLPGYPVTPVPVHPPVPVPEPSPLPGHAPPPIDVLPGYPVTPVPVHPPIQEPEPTPFPGYANPPPHSSPISQPEPIPQPGPDLVLTGTGGRDRLHGGSGDDLLSGRAGHDVLFGGLGEDVFVFGNHGAKHFDRITDFTPQDDTILLGRGAFKLPVGELKASAFWTGAKAHDASDRVIYDKKTGDLFYDPDGTGKAAQQKVADVGERLKLTHHDFLIF